MPYQKSVQTLMHRISRALYSYSLRNAPRVVDIYMNEIAESMLCTMSTACSRQLTLFQCSSSDCKDDNGCPCTTKRVRLSPGPDEDHFLYFNLVNFRLCNIKVSSVVYCLECTKNSLRTSEGLFSRESP